MNSYFCNVGSKLQEQINCDGIDQTQFACQIHPPVFEFGEISDEDIIDAITRLSNSQLCALDGITSFMVKSCKIGILPVLKNLFHHSLNERCFPKL